MQLILRLQENLAVNQLAITRNTERLPHALANCYRYNNTQPVDLLKQQIQQAEERLDWFEPLLEYPLLEKVTEIEIILVQYRNFFTDTNYQYLQKQWLWSIDQIGDFNQPQDLIYRLASRLQWLLKDWLSLLSAYELIKEIVRMDSSKKQIKLVEQFVNYWETLWYVIPNLESLDADYQVQNALQWLIDLESKIEVNP